MTIATPTSPIEHIVLREQDAISVVDDGEYMVDQPTDENDKFGEVTLIPAVKSEVPRRYWNLMASLARKRFHLYKPTLNYTIVGRQ